MDYSNCVCGNLKRLGGLGPPWRATPAMVRHEEGVGGQNFTVADVCETSFIPPPLVCAAVYFTMGAVIFARRSNPGT
jgi:hypothetical protein